MLRCFWPFSNGQPFKYRFQRLISGFGGPILLAIIVFIVYLPSLESDLIYDARVEILEEGFVTSLSNLSAVLSLKVLSMDVLGSPVPETSL